MKTFLETCLLTIPEILRQEHSILAELVPAENAPSPVSALTLVVSLGNSIDERFIVAADLPPLHLFLDEAGRAGAELDKERDHELWRGLLKKAATAAARTLGKFREPLVEDAGWPLDGSFSAYELRLGELSMCLGFVVDQEPAATPREPRAPAKDTGESASSKSRRLGVDLLLDVELEASLRFGSCEMSLNQVLELGPGDVVELDRHVADPVDLLVGDKIVARGEVVLVNGNFGLRIQEVAEPKQRLESVRCLF